MNALLDRRRMLIGLLALPGMALLARTGLLGRYALAQTEPLTAQHIDTLRRIAFLLFPYPELGQAPYERVAGAIAAGAGNAGTRALLDTGIADLDARQAVTWLELEERSQVAALAEIESGAFFQHLLQTTKMVLFNDPEVWAYIGYGGSSMDFGGYVNRGLNDIDWLDDD
ncbi:MAG: hypothetical protein OEW35_12655 [Gammaproteobacteria bacterium]|nr:hypothetical protein [Gammaproteobacteria bacterium]MDH4253330.1 hypothetical protein [Gammaproteobacteria bacterium]